MGKNNEKQFTITLLEEDPKKRSNWTNDAFEHTSPIGNERNIKVKKTWNL